MTKRGKDETEIKDEEKGQNFMAITFYLSGCDSHRDRIFLKLKKF